jgi:hypothetical protein
LNDANFQRRFLIKMHNLENDYNEIGFLR